MTSPNDAHAQPSRPSAARCPFTGTQSSESITRRSGEPSHLPEGQHQLGTFEAARDVLRQPEASQAGFLNDLAFQSGGLDNAPVLYMKGEEHTEMRRATARYFTPTAVAGYQPMIARLADDLIAELVRKGEVNVDDLSLNLAVSVASSVVGLTNSRLPGMDRRIEAFVSGGANGAPGTGEKPSGRQQFRMAATTSLFFLLDVKPAIEARRRERQDDLISYLLDRDYSDTDILTECITYATAGMITTREFITLAAYQLLTRPELRADYLHGTEKQRHEILHELLRLDPVVTTLYRRADTDFDVAGRFYPQGSVFAIDVQAANVDPAIMGEDAGQLCPHRSLPKGVQAQGLAFGDGPHRCPGAFLAIKESDVFLRRLLIWNDLELVQAPSVGHNELVKGYELRGLRVRLGGQKPSATHA